jgi:DNA-binding NtrC family response regulator
VPAPEALPTVLVADDEPRLLRLMARLLAERGYPVLSARNGDEALRASAAHAGAIGVAVLDANIAPDGALALLGALDAAQPGLGLVITSGGPVDGAERESLRRRGAVLLPKPFPARGLVDAVGDAARAPRPAPAAGREA